MFELLIALLPSSLCCWFPDWFLSRLTTRPPTLTFFWHKQELVCVCPGDTDHTSHKEKSFLLFMSCGFSVLCWLIPPDVLASRGRRTHRPGPDQVIQIQSVTRRLDVSSDLYDARNGCSKKYFLSNDGFHGYHTTIIALSQGTRRRWSLFLPSLFKSERKSKKRYKRKFDSQIFLNFLTLVFWISLIASMHHT